MRRSEFVARYLRYANSRTMAMPTMTMATKSCINEMLIILLLARSPKTGTYIDYRLTSTGSNYVITDKPGTGTTAIGENVRSDSRIPLEVHAA